MTLNKQKEAYQLAGVFHNVSASDFKKLPNGNLCIEVSYPTRGKYTMGTFEILIEYPKDFPHSRPKAWVQKPKIRSDSPHKYNFDEYGDCDICFTPSSNWKSRYTSYDAAMWIRSWIWAYCKWNSEEYWDWESAD